MKKRIVITSDCFLPRWDGVARFLSQLIPQLRNEYEITCIVPEFEGELRKVEGINIIRIPLLNLRFGDIFFSRFHYKQIKEIISQADIVFNQTVGPIGMCSIFAASKLKKPIISYVHSIEWELASKSVKRFKRLTNFFIRLIARKLYNKCNLLIVPSHDVEDLLSVNKIKTRKAVIKLGINTDIFSPNLLKRSVRKEINIDANSLVIGFCGRIGREKDLPTLYNAFRILRRKYNNLKLLIVGSGIEKEIPKNKDVIITGSINNVVPYLQSMDIYVLPSLTETSSLSTMEAMSCGLAVIATPVGSITEYIKDGINGFIFPRKDINRLVEKLDYLIRDEKLRTQLGLEARKTIVESYQWRESVWKIKEILRSSL